MAVGELNGNPQHSFYAVFDGHGGDGAAQFCVERMCLNLTKEPDFQGNPKTALTRAFLKTDEEYLELAYRLNRDDGTTAVAVLVHGDKIYAANGT